MMTRLAVPITAATVDQALKDIALARDAAAEMIELRLDYLNQPNQTIIDQMIVQCHQAELLVIATCRPVWEGGTFAGAEEARLQVLEWALQAGADYIDLEMVALENTQLELGKGKRIVSNHDFQQLPTDYTQRIERIKDHDAPIVKIAYKANRISDCFAALDLLHEESEPIAIAMGEAGMMTRLLAKKLGAFATFASLDEGKGSAPGQVSLNDMKNLYHWDTINEATQVFGVIGQPVGHSLSPHIHNGAFDQVGFNGVYLPLLIEGTWDEFKAFMDGVRLRKWLNARGFSVTIPHKRHALDWVKEAGGQLEPLAETIGAVNTIVIDDTGRVSGYNTDYGGALDAITETVGMEQADFGRMRAAIIGAGGVSRALVAGLTNLGAEVTIYNRTVERAQRLAEEFGCEWQSITAAGGLEADLVINCTSIGMHPKVEDSPLPVSVLRKEMIVFDTVYNPLETRLLCEAKSAGAILVDGLSMFVNQAVLQFERFTNGQAPRGCMRRIVEDALKRR